MPGLPFLARFTLSSRPAFHFCRGFALGAHPAFQFLRSTLPSAHPVRAILPQLFALGAHPAFHFWRGFALGSYSAFHFWRGSTLGARPVIAFLPRLCPRFAPSVEVLAQLFALARGWCCVSVAAICPQLTPGLPFLARLCSRFTPGHCVSAAALPSVHTQLYCSVVAFCLGSRLSFSSSRKKRRLAICSVPIPPGRDRHLCVLMPFGVICLGWFTSGLGVSLWRSRRSCRGTGTELRRERDWRRGLCASLRNHISIAMLSAGSTLGLRAPNLRQRVFDSLDSPHAAAGLGWCKFAAPSLGHTERPARL